MDEELTVLTTYAIELAIFGLFCTLIAYFARLAETYERKKKELKHNFKFHLHLKGR
jgi:hypothetical protein